MLVKSKSTYARFFIPEYLEGVPRCISLDTDLIIFLDLTVLQNLGLHGESTACVIVGVISTPDQ
jgi:lipopolysaccharide biosynthesis glycosyltransferase